MNIIFIVTIKKVKVRLLIDTDVYVGGETVGFNLFSEGVICVGSNAVATSEGTKEPIKEALKNGRITMDDVNQYNIRYYKEVKR